MTVSEALQIIRDARTRPEPPARMALACGFEPLHLATLATAHLQRRTRERCVEVRTGIYGDLLGNVERLSEEGGEALLVVCEWSDLDRRLGLRDLGGWRPADLADVLVHARGAAERLRAAIERAATRLPVAVCGPTLPLPPATHTPGYLRGEQVAELHAIVADLIVALARADGVHVVDAQRLDLRSPLAERLDVKAYLTKGFPYRVPHASTVSDLLAELVRPAPRKKGLITDLDDVLWRGILGEEGGAGVSWDLDRKTHAHGLYQQLLASLAESGVLLAVASKADRQVVETGLASTELLIGGDRFFPVEAHWDPKSLSVERILRAWNVGADSVVFVDDSPAELAEVAAAHPGIECVRFPTDDDAEIYALLGRLRDLFGTPRLSAEDALRAASVRRSAALTAEFEGGATRQDAFLADAEQQLTTAPVTLADARPLELVNKTNQFNVNGRRYTDGEWRELLARPDAVALVFAYQDKYGPLGKIAVVAGRRVGDALEVETWVLSCRAFSRRVEWAILDVLFTRLGIDTIAFRYRATAKNHLVKELFGGAIGTEPTDDAAVRLSRADFERHCPELFFRHVDGSAT
jgi:FkbH-like protein